MTELESKFNSEFISNCTRASSEFGCDVDSLLKSAEISGGLQTAKELLKRRRLSCCFDALAAHSALDLSLEAMVADTAYSPLFTDEEVNFCFSSLIEAGFYL